jgi:hypothetical protein
MKLLLLPKLILTALIAFGFSQAARAEDTPTSMLSTEKNEQRKEQKQEQKLKQEQLQKQKQKLKQEQLQKQKQKETHERKKEQSRFVDRNGDGIQDGREHRFRGKHRRRGKWSLDEAGDGDRRHRARGDSKNRR